MRGQINYLNATQCKAAKPKDKDYRLNDGGGMYLLIKTTGSKLWRMKYSIKGKTKLASFGKFPDINLKDARGKRAELRKLAAKDIDPIDIKNAKKLAEESTFKAVADLWIKRMGSKWTPRHAGTVRRSLEVDVYPKLGEKPVSEITSSMVLNTASAIADNRGAQDVARRVLRRISNVLEFAAVTDKIPVNPAIGVMKYMPESKANRKPMAAINWKELPTFLHAVESSDMFEQTRLALRFLILTFVRPGELRYARWHEFDMGEKEWLIPAERMKMDADHTVPLSRQAVEILEQLRAFSGDSEYVLPGRKTVMKPISENTLLYAIYRIGYKDQMTAHGCRALASTWLNEEGVFQFKKQPRAFNPDAIERQLAHGEPNKVRDAYNRADYMGEREVMMQTWADFVEQCSDNSSNVVRLRSLT